MEHHNGSQDDQSDLNATIEHFKANMERQRPIYNPLIPDNAPLKCNPVFRFSSHSGRLLCDKTDIITPPSASVSKCRSDLNWIQTAVGVLVIGYKNGLVSYASCFRVHQRLYLTSLQNTLPIPSYEGDLHPIKFWWSPSIQVPFNLSDTIRKEEDFKEEGFIPLSVVPRDARFKNLIHDIDPRSKKLAKIPSNFAFLSTNWALYDNLPYFTPSPNPPCSGDHIAIIGYHKPFPDPYWFKELFDFRMPSLPISPSTSAIESHFHGFGVKSVSPGCVLPPVSAFDEMGGLRLVAYDASSFMGASGAVVVPLPAGELPFSFIGVHSGSWTIADLCLNLHEVENRGAIPECGVVPNYNMAISVHHPHFLAEYVTRVVPLYGGNIPNSVKHYLTMHRKILQELGIFPL